MTDTLLRIDASARRDGSISRDLTDKVIDRLAPVQTITRDLAHGLPLLDEAWVGANFTPADQRTPDQAEKLALSDTLVAEIKSADTLVIGVPIYNFGVPAALKAWVDQVARAGVTFKYTENGPQGLLSGKRAILVVASGGTEAGSEIDFATNYMRHVLGFIGIKDVSVVTADRLMVDAEVAISKANAQVEALAA
ncbi:FMN-dependent NADH-azoreductase [Gymnodinialimonas hymeniacidonis]|uniref:FMN-dependent NADH-azoreductase n=1 Tax=Gymnodinialimonas hymeniacidonis TaxID=3126508 RepID=UPI0034C660FC